MVREKGFFSFRKSLTNHEIFEKKKNVGGKSQ